MQTMLWIIQLAPLITFCFLAFWPESLRKEAPLIGIFGSLLAFVSNVFLWITVLPNVNDHWFSTWNHSWLWISASGGNIQVGFLLDALNLLMLTVVTGVSVMVQIFSAAYMDGEKDQPRYFAFLSLFSFSMIGLVLSSNLLQTFMFWELVGLTSYLLIGFWFEKPSAANAARKAFVMNRLADLGFIIGLFLLFIHFGSLQILSFETQAIQERLTPELITLCGLLVLMGVMGKSAQFPFHTWLPDAMEGPTPVSALIHSATMVAAGVFLLARVFGLFAASTTTLMVILILGTITSLLSASLATIQNDFKKVLAYSTISQLGLMVMGIGAGAVTFSIFHLTTHALFKSMLFLTAGAFIHSFGTNDLFEMGKKGAKRETFLMFILLIGLASLSGIPPFAGFFSKDAILHHLMEYNVVFGIFGMIITFLTALYSMRLFMILASAPGNAYEGHRPKDLLKFCTRFPLALLAILSIIVGFAGSPILNNRILHWLDAHAHGVPLDITLLSITLGVIVAGALCGWLKYRMNTEGKPSTGFISSILRHNYFIDDIYYFLVHKVILRFAHYLHQFDLWLPNHWMVDKSAGGVNLLGKMFSRLQNGLLHNYLLIAFAFLFFVLYYFSRIGVA